MIFLILEFFEFGIFFQLKIYFFKFFMIPTLSVGYKQSVRRYKQSVWSYKQSVTGYKQNISGGCGPPGDGEKCPKCKARSR